MCIEQLINGFHRIVHGGKPGLVRRAGICRILGKHTLAHGGRLFAHVLDVRHAGTALERMQRVAHLAGMVLGRGRGFPGLQLLLHRIEQFSRLVGKGHDQPPTRTGFAHVFRQLAVGLRGTLAQGIQARVTACARLIGIQPGTQFGHGLIDQRALGIAQAQTGGHDCLAEILQLGSQLRHRLQRQRRRTAGHGV